MSLADPNLATLLARARAMTGPAAFGLTVRPDGGIADDGRPDATGPDDELVDHAVADVLLAVHAAHGRRWAARGDQDQWHEGDHSEAESPDPVRLDSFVRGVLAATRRAAGRPAPADLSGLHRTPRARLARAAVEAMSGWTPAHLCYMFGAEVRLPDVLAALDAPAPAPPVNYFRRLTPGPGAFAAGRTVLAGDQLPLETRRLNAPPTDPAVTRTLYARTTRRYEVPPTAGERAEAHG